MHLASLVGPSAMVASIAYVYHSRQSGAFPISTPVYICLLFLVYATGVIPRCPLFPGRFFKPNVFPLLYRAYCSEVIGYRFLKSVMHAPAQYPHSDFRTGIRLLSGERGKFSFLNVSKPNPNVRTAAAASRSSYYSSNEDDSTKKAETNSGRGTRYVDLSTISAQETKTGTLVIPVPMFADNYAYLIISLDTHRVVVVDPADPAAVLQLLRSVERTLKEPLMLTEVLTTHKHWDHAGGNQELLNLARNHAASTARPTARPDGTPATLSTAGNEALAYLVDPNLAIIGPEADEPMACTRLVHPGDLLLLAGEAVSVKVLQAPGHTRGSVMYLVGDVPPPASTASAARTPGVPLCTALFTGDALFSGGFGAPFETTSLASVDQTRRSFLVGTDMTTQPKTGATIAEDHVLIYCGHEYTERIVTEVEGITRKLIQSGGGSTSLQTYLRDVALEAKKVRALRVASDGLEDVANEARSHSHSTRPTYRLPISTMPTTLAIEKRINPLLTLDEEALRDPSVKGLWSEDTFDQSLLEQLLYCSPHRCVCDGTKKPAVSAEEPTAES